jgi:hypothetical protein
MELLSISRGGGGGGSLGIMSKEVFPYFDVRLYLIIELTCTHVGKTQVRCHFHPGYGPQW